MCQKQEPQQDQKIPDGRDPVRCRFLAARIEHNDAYLQEDGHPLQVKRMRGHFTLAIPRILPDEVANVVVLELDRQASEIEPMKL